MESEKCEKIVPTEKLRQKLRCYAQSFRTDKRKCEIDSLRFGLGEIQNMVTELDNLSEKDVAGLALRIKRRKHASTEDMFRLNNAFLQGNENINAFVNIPGAIQILVKEFTGRDSIQQIAACETLCNLSLGQEYVCEKIASLAGSYLMMYLDTNDSRLKRTSLWIISNIAVTGSKGPSVLITMEVVPKLYNLFINEKDPEIMEDAGIALDLIISNLELRSQDLTFMRERLTLKDPTSAGSQYHLKIIFNSTILMHGSVITQGELKYIIDFCIYNIMVSDIQKACGISVIYAVRLLANLVTFYPHTIHMTLLKLNDCNWKLPELLNKVFLYENKALHLECLWLLKNLLACQELPNPQELLRDIRVRRI